MKISAGHQPYLAAATDTASATAPVASPRPDDGWRSSWIARHRIGIFLALAFALSWWPWPLAVFNPDSAAMVSFGPIIAVVIVTAVAGKRRRITGLMSAVVRWRVPWSRYVIALAGPFVLAGVTGVLVIALEVVRHPSLSDAFGWSTWSALPLLLVTTTFLGGPLFEEVG